MGIAEGSQEILQVDGGCIVMIQRVDALQAVRLQQQFVSGGRCWDGSCSDETDFLKLSQNLLQVLVRHVTVVVA